MTSDPLPELRGTDSGIPPVIKAFFAANAAFALLFLMSRRLREWTFFKETELLWDLDRELTPSAWFSSMQLLLIGLLLAGMTKVFFRWRDRSTWGLPLAAALFSFFSLDEAAALHEEVGRFIDNKLVNRRETVFKHSGFWMVACLPPMLAVMILAGATAIRFLRGHRRIIIKYVCGIAIWIFCFAVLESTTNFMERPSFLYRLAVLLEESGEMFGVTLMLWATYELLKVHGVRLFTHEPTAQAAGPTGRRPASPVDELASKPA